MIPISDSIKSKKFPLLNIGLIIITIYVFFQQITSPNHEQFIYTYALIPSLIDQSDPFTWYPFVTSIFLHGGFLHIISNMIFLWVFGDNIEDTFGRILFLPFYIISGVIGNLLQYMIIPSSDIPMLGASGAIAGILGAYYLLFPRSKVKTIIPFFAFFTIVDIPAPYMLGYWFLLQVIAGAFSIPFLGAQTGGIAFFAHVGGFITGILFVTILFIKPKQ